MVKLEQLYDIEQYIDTLAPGFSARVVQATHWPSGSDVALKFMRRALVEDARVWQQFRLEIGLLLLLDDPVFNRLVDYGYLSDSVTERPRHGEILSYSGNPDGFAADMQRFYHAGWRPYLAIERLDWSHCLLNLILGTDGQGQRPLRLPTMEGLQLSLQFAQLLMRMHDQNVVYWDHKPEHAFWDGAQLRIIDLNVSRRLDDSLSPASVAQAKRYDVHHMIVGVLYTVFSGRDYRFLQQGAPKVVPMSPATVDQRFAGVSALDFGMAEGLNPAVIDLLTQYVLSDDAGLSAASFLTDLSEVAATCGVSLNANADLPLNTVNAAYHTAEGLSALREAQAKIEQARQHFMNAHMLNAADSDSERLYREASEFFRHRILP